MGWVNDCVELTLALARWTKQRYQSAEWKKRLAAVSRGLLLEDADLHLARETVKLARQAGFTGPELDTVEERIEAIRKYERERKRPPRTSATKMRKKRPAAKKPAKKKKVSAKKPAGKAAKRSLR